MDHYRRDEKPNHSISEGRSDVVQLLWPGRSLDEDDWNVEPSLSWWRKGSSNRNDGLRKAKQSKLGDRPSLRTRSLLLTSGNKITLITWIARSVKSHKAGALHNEKPKRRNSFVPRSISMVNGMRPEIWQNQTKGTNPTLWNILQLGKIPTNYNK